MRWVGYAFIGLFLGTMLGCILCAVADEKEVKQLVGKEIVISGDTLKVIGFDRSYNQLIMDDGSLLSKDVVKVLLDQ